MYTLSCEDMGHTGCPFVAKGETKEEVLKAGAAHAMEAHGMDLEMLKSADVQQKAMSMMKEA